MIPALDTMPWRYFPWMRCRLVILSTKSSTFAKQLRSKCSKMTVPGNDSCARAVHRVSEGLRQPIIIVAPCFNNWMDKVFPRPECPPVMMKMRLDKSRLRRRGET